jgi:hypothetical protein
VKNRERVDGKREQVEPSMNRWKKRRIEEHIINGKN